MNKQIIKISNQSNHITSNRPRPEKYFSATLPIPNNSSVASLPPTRPLNSIVMILGPTGAGKTALVHELARPGYDLIINADSRQFYQGMDIGTAKPSPTEQTLYGYHLIDILKPGKEISAHDFLARTLTFLTTVPPSPAVKKSSSHPRIFVVGGSMFYQEVLRRGLPPSVPIPNSIKTELQSLYETQGISALQDLLKQHDPAYYAMVDTHNHRRLLRALEVILTTRKTFTALRASQTAPPINILTIAVTRPRANLYTTINRRVDEMLENGWVAEVKSLLCHYPAEAISKSKTIGYEEIMTWLNEAGHNADHPQNRSVPAELSEPPEKIVTLIKQKTRNMAKSQLNWIKKNPPSYLVVHTHKNHDKTNTGDRLFSDPEDEWMNVYEMLKTGGNAYQPANLSNLKERESQKCKLMVVQNAKDKSDMLNTLERIIGNFYE